MPLSPKQRLDRGSQRSVVNDRSHSEPLQQPMNEQTYEQVRPRSIMGRPGSRI
jgi:hypothetical protein